MKKLIALFTALTFALPFSVALAQEKMTAPEKKEEMTPAKEKTKTVKKDHVKKHKTAKKKKAMKKKEEPKKEEPAPMAPTGK